MRNARGQVTIDFIFAMVLVLGFTGLLFIVTFSLSVAALTQYITFAAARNAMAAHMTQVSQTQRGYDKYHELIANPVFKPLYSNGWFSVDADATIADHTTIFPDYVGAAQGTNDFWGAGTNFVARILDFHIPFFGSTAPDSDGSGSGFKTYLASYLGREPSADECIQFTAVRWHAIRGLSSTNGAISYSTGTTDSNYYPMTDDGC